VVAFLHQPQDNHYVLLALEAVSWLKPDAINAFGAFGEPRLPAGRGGLPGLPHGLPVNSFSELVERAVLKNETKRQLNKKTTCEQMRIHANNTKRAIVRMQIMCMWRVAAKCLLHARHGVSPCSMRMSGVSPKMHVT